MTLPIIHRCDQGDVVTLKASGFDEQPTGVEFVITHHGDADVTLPGFQTGTEWTVDHKFEQPGPHYVTATATGAAEGVEQGIVMVRATR